MQTVNERIRLIRQARQFTLDELAMLSGYTKGYLSRLERSDKPPPVDTIEKLALCLDVDVSALLLDEERDAVSDYDLMTNAEQRQAGWRKNDDNREIKSLLHTYRYWNMAPYLARVFPGETKPLSHDSEKYYYVLDGSLSFMLNGDCVPLNKGDSICIYARMEHYFVNETDKAAIILCVVYHYRRF